MSERHKEKFKMTNLSLKTHAETCFAMLKKLADKTSSVQLKNYSAIGNKHCSYTVIVSGEREAAAVGEIMNNITPDGSVSVVSYNIGKDYIGINILEKNPT